MYRSPAYLQPLLHVLEFTRCSIINIKMSEGYAYPLGKIIRIYAAFIIPCGYFILGTALASKNIAIYNAYADVW